MNFLKVAAACPKTDIANIKYNIEEIKTCIIRACQEECKLIVFPELAITSYTCGDLFLQSQLQLKTIEGLEELVYFSKDFDVLIAVGAPLEYNCSLYNCAMIIFKGKILGIVPKSYIPNYSEFYEKRWFTEGLSVYNKYVNLSFQKEIPFGCDIIFKSKEAEFAFEICEDLWVTIPPSSFSALAGAQIIGNLSASNELVSKSDYRKSLVQSQSARTMSAYIYSSSGVHESTTDLLFSGHLIIGEDGVLLEENSRFNRESEIITAIIDIERLKNDRMKNISFSDSAKQLPHEFRKIAFEYKDISISSFSRVVEKHPFVPSQEALREERCKEIFNIQASALAKRLEKTGLKKTVIGISGGLDSTLALLVAYKTCELLNIDKKNIISITMPGFGTTDRTYNNAVALCGGLGTELREISIVAACLQHFKDIGHDPSVLDVTYENVQARERTQILMDIANKEGGLVVGTGDLSELALGWCTYNGDHMSMYAVNCSIPKTLVRYLVKYVAENEMEEKTSDILLDILDTPVSPELLPKDEKGEIAQKTEDIIGPYELHDFFLYHFIRQGADNEKILFLAKEAFNGIYEEAFIIKWYNNFITRFFRSQFKRSAIPDGPKVGSISLSPRGDWRMPSDSSFDAWK